MNSDKTLRDELAMSVLPALIARIPDIGSSDLTNADVRHYRMESYRQAIAASYAVADLMIIEREKPGNAVVERPI